ncbi:FAD-dependent oxidoreductase [Streptomyces sp. NPDC001568]|uniref:FAD-dependent oxidoreductase n=1 Tax=Streptomyces sp. NPDC001568 TaxID=3364588 RepID=UPI0036807C29
MVSRIVVAGGGIAGLSTALLLARQGYAVDLVERDGPPPEDLGSIQEWQRPGAPQVRHPHMFLGLFRHLLHTRLPDVHVDLIAHGVDEVDMTAPPGIEAPAGARVLASFGSRRATVEWVLHGALRKQTGVRLHHGLSVREVVADQGRVRGVRVDGAVIESDVVVDATGRRSPLVGAFTKEVEESPCGTVYHSRFYRLSDGVPKPPTFLVPVVFAGGAGFGGGLYAHDDRTFAVVFARLPEDETLGRLRRTDAFEAAANAVAQFGPWLRPGACEPIGDVVPMAGLTNSWRELSPETPAGYLPLGDVLCTTDPILGRGASFALAGAAQLSDLMARHPTDLEAVAAGLRAFVESDIRPWYEDGVHDDVERTRSWRATVDGLPEPPAGLPPAVLAALAGQQDHRLWEQAQLRANLMAAPDSLDTPEVRERLDAVLATGWEPPVLSPGPSYAELTDALAAHGG